MSMYAALWRALPGGRWAKVAQCLALALLVVAVLFRWVFPALSPRLPLNQETVDDSSLRVVLVDPVLALGAPLGAAGLPSTSPTTVPGTIPGARSGAVR